MKRVRAAAASDLTDREGLWTPPFGVEPCPLLPPQPPAPPPSPCPFVPGRHRYRGLRVLRVELADGPARACWCKVASGWRCVGADLGLRWMIAARPEGARARLEARGGVYLWE